LGEENGLAAGFNEQADPPESFEPLIGTTGKVNRMGTAWCGGKILSVVTS
jgi:hypothetical protein